MRPGIIARNPLAIKSYEARPRRAAHRVTVLGLGLALLAASGLGCSSPGWAGDRARDAADVLTLTVSVGPGFGVHAGASRFVQIGGGWVGTERVPIVRAGLNGRNAGAWTERRVEYGILAAYVTWMKRDPLLGIVAPIHTGAAPPRAYTFTLDAIGDNDRGHADIGASVHAGLIGVAVYLRFGELVDLFAGFLGFDLVGDDVAPTVSPPPDRPPPASRDATESR